MKANFKILFRRKILKILMCICIIGFGIRFFTNFKYDYVNVKKLIKKQFMLFFLDIGAHKKIS